MSLIEVKVPDIGDFSDVPVIILTARTTVQDHTFALEVGADAFLEKPFKLKALEEEIARLIKGTR